jgi:hypothetical protein
MKRSCQRQTQVFDLPVRRIDLVRPGPVDSEQDDRGPPNMLLPGVAIFDESFKPLPLGRRNRDWSFLRASRRLVRSPGPFH